MSPSSWSLRKACVPASAAFSLSKITTSILFMSGPVRCCCVARRAWPGSAGWTPIAHRVACGAVVGRAPWFVCASPHQDPPNARESSFRRAAPEPMLAPMNDRINLAAGLVDHVAEPHRDQLQMTSQLNRTPPKATRQADGSDAERVRKAPYAPAETDRARADVSMPIPR